MRTNEAMQLLNISLLGALQACIGLVFANVQTQTTDVDVQPVVEFESFLNIGIATNMSVLNPANTTSIFTYKANDNVLTECIWLFDNAESILNSTSPAASDLLNFSGPNYGQEYNWMINLTGPMQQYVGHFLHFEVSWNNTQYTGISYSGVFTFGYPGFANNPTFQNASPYKSETKTLISNAIATQSQTAPTTQTTATATSSIALASGSSSNSTSVSHKSTSSHKGLKGGAIAGIVVGVLVGLAAVLGLVWLFFRRRQRNKHGYSSARRVRSVGPGVGAGVVAHPGGEEDDDAAVSVGNGAGIGIGVGVGATAVAAAGVAAEKSRAVGMVSSDSERNDGANSPYTDDIDFAADNNISDAPVISGHVAALIEDGMTAEDVARLAAEEMELDAAIQNADQTRATEATAHL